MEAFDRLRVGRESYLIKKKSEDDSGTQAIVLTFSKKPAARDPPSMPSGDRIHLRFSHVRHAGFVPLFFEVQEYCYLSVNFGDGEL